MCTSIDFPTRIVLRPFWISPRQVLVVPVAAPYVGFGKRAWFDEFLAYFDRF